MTGPLRGNGVLAIWNGIAPGHDAEFLRWHVNEHIPERLAVPGFQRARRYAAVAATPAYFNIYEVDDPSVLTSDAYVARLDDPSAWTRDVVPNFTDTARTLCEVSQSAGAGVAGYILALRLSTPAQRLAGLVAELSQSQDVSAVHLLARTTGSVGSTSESKMRNQPDESSASILLIEGVEHRALTDVGAAIASDADIRLKSGAVPTHRGLYQLDFMMDRVDVVRPSSGKKPT